MLHALRLRLFVIALFLCVTVAGARHMLSTPVTHPASSGLNVLHCVLHHCILLQNQHKTLNNTKNTNNTRTLTLQSVHHPLVVNPDTLTAQRLGGCTIRHNGRHRQHL